jgi:hypothetical protein
MHVNAGVRCAKETEPGGPCELFARIGDRLTANRNVEQVWEVLPEIGSGDHESVAIEVNSIRLNLLSSVT